MLKTVMNDAELIIRIEREDDPEFYSRAKCSKYYTLDYMFPEGTRTGMSKVGFNREEAEQEVANNVCRGGDGLGPCPVETECFVFWMRNDLASGESNGVAGGMTALQRRERRLAVRRLREEIKKEAHGVTVRS